LGVLGCVDAVEDADGDITSGPYAVVNHLGHYMLLNVDLMVAGRARGYLFDSFNKFWCSKIDIKSDETPPRIPIGILMDSVPAYADSGASAMVDCQFWWPKYMIDRTTYSAPVGMMFPERTPDSNISYVPSDWGISTGDISYFPYEVHTRKAELPLQEDFAITEAVLLAGLADDGQTSVNVDFTYTLDKPVGARKVHSATRARDKTFSDVPLIVPDNSLITDIHRFPMPIEDFLTEGTNPT